VSKKFQCCATCDGFVRREEPLPRDWCLDFTQRTPRITVCSSEQDPRQLQLLFDDAENPWSGSH
jgi:hypothetical protein